MSPAERESNIAHAERGHARSLRSILDDICARLDALEENDESADHGGKSERGKIKASVTRLEKRVKKLEGSG